MLEATGVHAGLGAALPPKSTASPAPAEPEEVTSSPTPPNPADRPESKSPKKRGASSGAAPPPRVAAAAQAGRRGAFRPLGSDVVERRSAPSPGTARSIERAAIFERILAATSGAPLLQGSRIRLALRSATLGDLLIEMTLEGSTVHARMTAASEEARAAILSQIDDLRGNLEGKGLRLEKFQVSVDPGASPGEDRSTGDDRPLPRSARPQVLDITV